MKHRVCDLEGVYLDLAVALWEGWAVEGRVLKAGNLYLPAPFRYSTEWMFGGPIIEQQGITIVRIREAAKMSKNTWGEAEWRAFPSDSWVCVQSGSTPLIAAMRCFVASKYGDEIDLPELPSG
jgi:hypothetical protein